jgi:diacylglycerol kinase family enzyme
MDALMTRAFVRRRAARDADREFSVYADGDEVAPTPAQVTIAPAALRVRTPRSRDYPQIRGGTAKPEEGSG